MIARFSICIAGKNAIAVHALTEVLKYLPPTEVCVLPNQTDSGQDVWQPSLLKHAREKGVQVVRLDQLYSICGLRFFSLEYDRIITPARFRSTRLYNMHFSALPAYRGMYTAVWPILNGEEKAGVTLHEIESGIDTGNIIDQSIFDISEKCTARELYFRFLCEGASVFDRNWRNVYDDRYTSHPQPAHGASYYSKGSIDFTEIVIDLNKTATEISRQVRAFIFPEYQLPTVCGYTIREITIMDARSDAKPGTVIDDRADHIIISSIDYDVRLEKQHINGL